MCIKLDDSAISNFFENEPSIEKGGKEKVYFIKDSYNFSMTLRVNTCAKKVAISVRYNDNAIFEGKFNHVLEIKKSKNALFVELENLKRLVLKKTPCFAEVIDDVKLETSDHRANYGEMKMESYFKEKGYKRIGPEERTSIYQKSHQGIDGVYCLESGKSEGKDEEKPFYVIAEAKYGCSELTKTADGKQMSDSWIMGSNRLERAVGKEWADKILLKGYSRKLIIIPFTGIQEKELYGNGNIICTKENSGQKDSSQKETEDDGTNGKNPTKDAKRDLDAIKNLIKEDKKRVENLKEGVKELEKNREKAGNIYWVQSKIHDLNLGILIAKYTEAFLEKDQEENSKDKSWEEKLEELKKEYEGLLKEWIKWEKWEKWKKDWGEGNLPEKSQKNSTEDSRKIPRNNYYKNLKMISLGILFEVEGKTKMGSGTYATKFKERLDKEKSSDWLLEWLLSQWTGDERIDKGGDLIFEKTFSTLKKIVDEDKENAKKDLEAYLKRWKEKVCDCNGADQSKENIYYGYWSFEAGAVAKKLKIDDTGWEKQEYYPYDLVRYKCKTEK